MNVVIVGFMGTGKTTVARLLAERLRLRYVSTDTMIEEREHRRIREIFATQGEPHFRQVEGAVLRSLRGQDGMVVDCGGGAVVDPATRGLVKTLGRVIVLTARPEVIVERAKANADRPLLQVPDPLAEARRLLAERQPGYQDVAQAGLILDTSQAEPDVVCEAIMIYLQREAARKQ